MSATTHDGLRVSSRARSRARSLSLPYPELAALLVLAAALNLWSLSRNGWANDYYAGAVRSMAASWHNFLFGSLDPSGVMTVDKPPLALWVQALSVRIFGWHSLSVLVPQALMGVATVGLVYDLVRRRFGRAGGFAAGAVLASTPIAVAISRHNNPDAALILCVVFALWAMVRALEDGRVRWLVLCGVGVGLGFEAKMGAALLVVPAVAVAWLWAAPRNRWRGLFAGLGAMLVAGGFWPVIVALTPASSRPFISGTSDNSVWSLIMDYNGLGRLDGQQGGPAGTGGGFGGGGGAGGIFGGDTGPLRLLDASLGGQAGWLLGFALVAGLALAVSSRLRRRDPVTGWILATGGSALTIAVAFSSAKGIFHPYYVSELAPFEAALVGAGVARFTRGDTLARIAGAVGDRRRRPDRVHGARRPQGVSVRRARRAGPRRPGRRRAARARLQRSDAPRRGRGCARLVADRARRVVGRDPRPRDRRDLPGGRPDRFGRSRRLRRPRRLPRRASGRRQRPVRRPARRRRRRFRPGRRPRSGRRRDDARHGRRQWWRLRPRRQRRRRDRHGASGGGFAPGANGGGRRRPARAAPGTAVAASADPVVAGSAATRSR